MTENARIPPRPPGQPRLLAAAGHYWTIAPVVRHTLRPRIAPPSRHFSTWAKDAQLGRVRLSGQLSDGPEAGPREGLVIIVHGLGGDVGSHYVLDAARAADEAGLASLRLNLRGADLTGEDLYHAALTGDLHAAIASPDLSGYARLYVLGYSLGGHLALRAVTESIDARVRAVAAVCPPLDLNAGVRAIDAPRRVIYRRHLLGALCDLYAAVARRRSVRVPPAVARRIRSIREWDERIVAPRFGFDSADHYYTEASVAPRLTHVAVPTLVVAARHDPMVPASTVLPALQRLSPALDARWIDLGGHVGFPPAVDLGLPGARGVEPQIMAWLSQHR